MTTPAPTPTSSPAPAHEGFLGHVRDWFEKDVMPEIDGLKADLGKVRALAPELKSVADTVLALAKAADPAAAPAVAALVADAEKAAVVIGQIAAELAAAGM